VSKNAGQAEGLSEQKTQVRKSARRVAKADALCQPRVAAVPEQVMGSVSITIFGNTLFRFLGPAHKDRACAARQCCRVKDRAFSPARNDFTTLARRGCRLTATARATAQYLAIST
jgi:hypothetical protein